MKLRRLDPTTSPLDVLQKYWGYSSFRPMQEEVIEALLGGDDTLALMPTGGGKSITFQVPALMSEGVAIVVTPLVALMKDQVDDLRRRRIKATYIHAGMFRSEILNALDNVLHSDYKLLYVSPERLKSPLFLQRIQMLQVSFVVVDECHCISQWGFDFRPEYLQIRDFRQLLPKDTPLLALTATATPKVVSDVQRLLEFRPHHQLFRLSFYRKNLSYVVRKTGDKLRETMHILSKVPGSTLIYIQNRKKTKEWAHFLREAGFNADYFHAGLLPDVKAEKQEAWQSGKIRIMVCTNAFGMGINKEDVRLVIHPTAPLSPESYYQEAGRAARDNKRAYAVLLYTPVSDDRLMANQLKNKYPSREEVRAIYDAIGNYFQLGVESGEGALYEFDIYQFCRAYHFSSQMVLGALNLLFVCGYMQYFEDHDLPSRLCFLADRNELYSLFTDVEAIYDDVIEFILRHYPGAFTEYVYLNEADIADQLHISLEQVNFVLKNLRRWHVIEYIPGKRSNYIQYLQQRLPSKRLRFPTLYYEDRVKTDQERLGVMLDYLHADDDECRVRLLTRYFGEEDALPCGYCDICLAHPPKELTHRQVDEVEEYLLAHPSSTEAELSTTFPSLSSLEIAQAITFLKREGHIH